jgi:hypothetical protein
MHKTESISLRVTEDVKKTVERAARSKQLTTAAFVERVLIEGLRQQGYLRPTASPACEAPTPGVRPSLDAIGKLDASMRFAHKNHGCADAERCDGLESRFHRTRLRCDRSWLPRLNLALRHVYRRTLRGATRAVRVSSAIGGKADMPLSRGSICSTSLTIKEILHK